MKFEPKTEKEVAEAGLFQPGLYDFEVLSSIEKISKAGNEMIELKLQVFDEDGNSRTIFDYLLESNAAKLRHVAAACGLIGQYERGELNATDFDGKTGQLKLRIQKDKTGEYPDKNTVSDYLAPKDGAATTQGRAASDAEGALADDEIPF